MSIFDVKYTMLKYNLPDAIKAKDWNTVEKLLNYLEVPNNLELKDRIVYCQLFVKAKDA